MDAHKIVVADMQESINRALRLRILSNPRIHGDFYKDPTCISSKYTRFANQADYLQNYHHKYEHGEYLATLQDGAFLQVHYEFERSGKRRAYLKKMNLCYLPAVVDDSMKNEYIRVDFDSTNQNSFFHPVAHVHIGFTNSVRLPVDEVFLFSEFLRWIICNFLQFHIGVAVEKCLSNDFTKRASVNIVEQGGAMINLAGANDVAQPTATPITEISMLFRTAKYTPPFPRERGCA